MSSVLGRVLAVTAVVALVGCSKGCERTKPVDPVVDTGTPPEPAPALKPHFDERLTRLELNILAVHQDQKPSAAAPWHEAGGTWTFLDAELVDGGRLGFGYDPTRKQVTDVRLTVPTAEDGARITDAVAKVFGAKVPGALPPTPLVFPTLRGTNVRDDALGWSATIMLGAAHVDGFVSIVLDADRKHGALVVDGRNLSNAAVPLLARRLRDGPRAARTPETDPRVSAVGPKLAGWRPLAKPGSRVLGFAPGGHVLYERIEGAATRVMEASAEGGDAVELARTAKKLVHFECAAIGDTCILVDGGKDDECITLSETVCSGGQPPDVSLVDRRTRTARFFRTGSGATIAPDGSVVVFQGRAQDGGSGTHLVFKSVAGDSAPTLDLSYAFRSFQWAGAGAGLRLYGLTAEDKRTVALDPRTATASVIEGPIGTRRSPDGLRYIDCGDDGSVQIHTVASKETKAFTPHEDDRALHGWCASFVTSRYLQFDRERRGFIDLQTMKNSYLFASESDDKPTIQYSPALDVAVGTDAGGLHVSRIVVR